MTASQLADHRDEAATLLRVTLGVMFIAHALLKYVVFTLPGTAQFFGSLGLPPIAAYLVFAAELIGGAMLILGVYARYVAIALLPVLRAPRGRTPATDGSSPLRTRVGVPAVFEHCRSRAVPARRRRARPSPV